MEGIIVIRNIMVENANAIAGQTWGFPAISNFLGYVHALQRKLSTLTESDFSNLKLNGCGVICHQSQVHAYQASGYSEYVFSLTRNPLTKEAKSPSFVEEGRMHMTVSLVIGIDEFPDLSELEIQQLEQKVKSFAVTQRLAGGTITGLTSVKIKEIPDGSEKQEQQANFWLRTLLPGFALVNRTDLLVEHSKRFAESKTPQLDAWLDAASLNFDLDNQIKTKPYSGWIKPIAIGFNAISPLYKAGEIAKCRDETTPVQFVENIYSLGEWLSPHRIKKFEDIMWYYQTDLEKGTYLCQNNYQSQLEQSI
ncbi:type I-F CRISPR-associated protein Csy2 [Aliikangiella maris]|uniref:Type I-F CRISPR-associated protein Csy2 n=2 Tax=Aliikangiella maris TaxID=3162458 RepID=A0ABV2BSU7_9GAMM